MLSAEAYFNGNAAATGYENASLAGDENIYQVQGRFRHYKPTGSGHTLTLPDARTLTVGEHFYLLNRGTDAFDYDDNAGTNLGSVPVGYYHRCYLADNSTQAGIWICTERVANPSFLFVYLFGGDGSNNDSVYKYDPTAGTWGSGGDDIGTSSWLRGAAFPLAGVGYIAGGTPGSETEARQFKPGNGTWVAIDDLPRAHTATYGDAIQSVSEGYVVGGNSSSSTNEQIEKYQIAGTWSSPGSRSGTNGSANGVANNSRDRLWVMNGFRVSVGYTNTVASFDPNASDTWTEESPFAAFPSPLRREMGGATVSEDLYVLAGNNGTSYYQDCEKGDTSGGPGAISWAGITDLPVSGRSRGAATHGTDRVYFMGGQNASTDYDDVVEYDTVGATWNSPLSALPETKTECANQAVTLAS